MATPDYILLMIRHYQKFRVQSFRLHNPPMSSPTSSSLYFKKITINSIAQLPVSFLVASVTTSTFRAVQFYSKEINVETKGSYQYHNEIIMSNLRHHFLLHHCWHTHNNGWSKIITLSHFSNHNKTVSEQQIWKLLAYKNIKYCMFSTAARNHARAYVGTVKFNKSTSWHEQSCFQS